MKSSALFLISLTFLAIVVALASHASAQCTSCVKEGDWSQSASAFISGHPISEEPIPFGPKAVRKTESQFERADDTQPPAGSAADAGIASAAKLILKSINATPAIVNASSPVRIAAIFALNNSSETENQTEIQIAATASIKGSTGKEVAKLNLIKSSGNEYYQNWITSVQPGIYRVDISASSLQASESFVDVLQIEVK